MKWAIELNGRPFIKITSAREGCRLKVRALFWRSKNFAIYRDRRKAHSQNAPNMCDAKRSEQKANGPDQARCDFVTSYRVVPKW